MDPLLEDIAQAAEAEKPVPYIQCWVSGLWMSGLPSSLREYHVHLESALVRGNSKVKGGKRSMTRDQRNMVDAVLESTSRATREPGILYLVDAEIHDSGGRNFATAALRVRLESVDAWTMGQIRVSDSESGPSFFVGGLIPLGN